MPPPKPAPAPPACSAHPPARWLLWVGTTSEAELSLAHTWLREALPVVVAENPRQAGERFEQGSAAHDGLRADRESTPSADLWAPRKQARDDFSPGHPAAGTPWNAAPTLILLASDRPGRWSLDDVILLTSRWPLVPVISVGSSLCDGRRRSGPALPGVEEISWHDLAGRSGRGLADLGKNASWNRRCWHLGKRSLPSRRLSCLPPADCSIWRVWPICSVWPAGAYNAARRAGRRSRPLARR